MRFNDPEYTSRSEFYEAEEPSFIDKLRKLLRDKAFEEPADMLEARIVILQTLENDSLDSDRLQSFWVSYGEICEEAVDSKTDVEPHTRARLQIAMLVHKALLFREMGDIQRYCEDLEDIKEYAFNMHFDEIVEAINTELDELAS